MVGSEALWAFGSKPVECLLGLFLDWHGEHQRRLRNLSMYSLTLYSTSVRTVLLFPGVQSRQDGDSMSESLHIAARAFRRLRLR